MLWGRCMIVVHNTCLEIVESSSRDIIVKFLHHVPRSISHPN
ncbi:hypothetical protein HanPSC8_Chr02g0050101 [Helianthus annuus]|nr:hypothetical protein HanPSC8_Chr02g0050101 [Helianthus annuus]